MPDPSTGQPHFDAAQRRQLVQHARDAVGAALRGESAPSGKGSGALREPCGVFVTWRRQIDGRLRGCIGQVEAREPLEDAVAHMAVAAALEDPRFAPVSLAELPKLRLEISVLSRFVPVRPEDVVVGRHGLMIRHGAHRGLLLPQVPVEEGWDTGDVPRWSVPKGRTSPRSLARVGSGTSWLHGHGLRGGAPAH